MAERYSFLELKMLALVVMYELLARDLSDNVTVPKLKKILGERASLNLLHRAVQDLYQPDQYVYFGKGAGDDTDWRLTQNGIQRAEDYLEKIDGLPNRVNNFLDDDVQASNVSGNKDYDDWQPLPLEVGASEITEAAIAVEDVIEAVRSDNGYAATHPEEHKSILWALGSGVNALREGLITKYALDNFLLKPLRKLIERFVDAAIQISAKKALEKVLTLFTNV